MADDLVEEEPGRSIRQNHFANSPRDWTRIGELGHRPRSLRNERVKVSEDVGRSAGD
jgi:hypothetical protein